MKGMKIFFTAILMFVIASASAFAADTADIEWSIDAGTLIISGNGNMPDYAQKNAVPWYSQIDNIKSVNISEGITKIGTRSFYGCKNLKSVSLPITLSSVGNYAFYGCGSLTDIEFPTKLSSIGSRAFYNCTQLKKVDMSGTLLASIGSSAFRGCKQLTDVLLGEEVYEVGDEAFADCENLTNINFPQKTESFGEEIFSDCSENLQISVIFGSDAVEFCSLNGYTSVVFCNADFYNGDKLIKRVKNKYNSQFALPEPSDVGLETEGYDFHGWKNGENVIQPSASITADGNMNFYAQQTEKTYTVTYDANGGEMNELKQTKYYHTSLKLTDQQPQKAGCTFKGWSKNKEAVIKDYSPGDYFNENSNTTLYAVWSDGIITGDVNNDGELNLADLVLMLRLINEYDDGLSSDAINSADVNNDTYFNVKDVLKMAQYLAGWSNVVLGE